MNTFIGTKVIQAEPREKDGLPGYRVLYEDGYESWSPAEAFEKAYRPIGVGLTFGQAIEAAKIGKKVCRSGWNGKGIYVVLQKGYPEGIGANANTAKALGIPEGQIVKTRPYLAMIDAQGMLVTGWLASQTDMLEEDWLIVEAEK